jgi:L-erythro-3,5-diaminohexanoate dehydrogenase
VLPEDLSAELSLAVLDVCGAPALTKRVVKKSAVVLVVGAAGKSGSLSAAAARQAGASRVIAVVPTETEAQLLRHPATTQDEGAGGMPTDVRPRPAADLQAPQSPLADVIVVADARDPVGLAEKVEAAGGPADVTVVCVDVAGCEGGAILSTKQGGTVIFFSMATSFSAAALGAEGMAADVTMLVGNGYVPGHADFALNLIRTTPSVRQLFERRVGA